MMTRDNFFQGSTPFSVIPSTTTRLIEDPLALRKLSASALMTDKRQWYISFKYNEERDENSTA